MSGGVIVRYINRHNQSPIHRSINKITIHVMSQTVILFNRKVTWFASHHSAFLIKHPVHTSEEKTTVRSRHFDAQKRLQLSKIFYIIFIYLLAAFLDLR